MHLVVIGAGPHGLAVLSALADGGSWPERVTVVDPHDHWCAAWDAKLARLALDRLRSPQVHHPGVHPMELRDMVEACPPEEQLLLRRPEAERAPTPAGMRRYLDQLVERLGPVDWLRGRAVALTVAAEQTSRSAAPPTPRPGDPGPVTVSVMPMTDGPGEVPAQDMDPALIVEPGVAPITLVADAVVVAHNPSMPRVPGWSAPLLATGRARHASEVDIQSEEVSGREVLIVGGGLTAACLALEVLRRGGHPTMVTRRPLRARPYDVDASWIGPRRLEPYLRAPATERRALIDVARDGGTIPPRTLEQLRAAADDPATPLTLLEAVDVEPAVQAQLASGTEPAPALWLATGFEQHLDRDPLLGPVAEQLGVRSHGGLPEVDEALRLGGAPIYVAGPYAALGVGPACRNLAGARPAAQRIAAGLRAQAEALPAA